MGELKDELMNILHRAFVMTLTYNPDNLTLSWNQTNVPVSTMSDVLHHLSAKICWVHFSNEMENFECRTYD